jgi:hypothetical protein
MQKARSLGRGVGAADGDVAGGGGAAGAGGAQLMARVGRGVRATTQQQGVRDMRGMRLERVHPAGHAATGTGAGVGAGAGVMGRVGTTMVGHQLLQSKCRALFTSSGGSLVAVCGWPESFTGWQR